MPKSAASVRNFPNCDAFLIDHEMSPDKSLWTPGHARRQMKYQLSAISQTIFYAEQNKSNTSDVMKYIHPSGCSQAVKQATTPDVTISLHTRLIWISQTTDSALILSWSSLQLAQPIRLLLEYTGTKYEDKFYVCGEAPNFDKSCWFDEKHTLGMDFPNLPYLEDGDKRIVQSNAIMRYVARKHNMCGITEEEQVRVDILENQAMDFRNGFVRLCYTDCDKMKPGYLEMLPSVLKQFSDFLGDRKWFAGVKITFVDFIMYELLDQHRMFHPTCLDDFKNLRDLLDRFEALEKIASYMKSERFMKTPVNNKMAKWGNKKE